MTMAGLAIEIADDVLEALRVPPGEVDQWLRRELALRSYEKELLSLGAARRLARLSKWEFIEALAAERIGRHYDSQDFADDLATLEQHG
jgi:predicted HTH domain antitoxin